MIPQMPDAKLATEVPNRPRSYRVLGHHIFRIAETFLEVANGATLEYGRLTSTPPDDMQTTADIVAYGADVRQRLAAWWAAKPDRSARETVQTYYGPQMLHEYLERSTWHVGQHVRQWNMLLGMAGIAADRPPGRGRFRRSADAKPGVGRVTRDKRAAGPVAPRSAARPQAAAGPVPAHAARRLESRRRHRAPHHGRSTTSLAVRRRPKHSASTWYSASRNGSAKAATAARCTFASTRSIRSSPMRRSPR